MNTLIRTSAFAALGLTALQAIPSLLDRGRVRRVANAKAVSAGERDGGNPELEYAP
jgi:hypothetical protein